MRPLKWVQLIFISLAVGMAPFSCLADDKPQQKATVTENKFLLIRNINLLTMSDDKARVLKNHAVLIEGNKIINIAPDASMPKESSVVEINGKNRFLLPGLIDMHVHVWDEAELSAYLAFGVTTVRNAAGMPFHLEFGRKIEEGRMQGPRLITTGPILNGLGPNTQVNHQIVSSAEEARRAVRQQYELGYRYLKVYSNLSREAYEAILSEARQLNMGIMGHTPEGIRDSGTPYQKPFDIAFSELLDDHFTSIEHMETIVWHGLYDDLNENKARKLAKAIAQSGTAVTPTLMAHHNLVLVAQTQGQYLQRPGTELLNPFISALEKESYLHWSAQPPGSRKNYEQFYRRATKIFQQQGVVLLAGTDAGVFTNIPGLSLSEELKLLVSAGLTPYQAIKTATVNPARVLGLSDQVGKIAPGYVADLLLVDGDPTRDIAWLQSPSGLVARGKWYDAEGISNLKQQASATSYDRTERRVREGLAVQGGALD